MHILINYVLPCTVQRRLFFEIAIANKNNQPTFAILFLRNTIHLKTIYMEYGPVPLFNS